MIFGILSTGVALLEAIWIYHLTYERDKLVEERLELRRESERFRSLLAGFHLNHQNPR